MAWETRNGKQYYYAKRWQNGKCVSEYRGAAVGPIGELLAMMHEIEQLERLKAKNERAKWQKEQERITNLDRQIEAVCSEIQAITHAVLVATGHHQHKGLWRKKRMDRKQKEAKANAFLMRLQKGRGSSEDVQQFKKAIKEVPAVLKLFDLAENARETVITQFSGDNQAMKIANQQLLENIKQELGYNDASVLEKLLIEQIILCHTRLYWVENLFTANLKVANSAGVIHWEKRLNANQCRYFRAIETLAKIRHLARRTPEILQINIAEQQVNQISQ